MHVIEWMYTRRVRERALWSWDEHAAITARIAERDPAAAEVVARDHIRKARDAYFATSSQPAHLSGSVRVRSRGPPHRRRAAPCR